MKNVEGWFVPDADEHFTQGLETYQEASFQIALSVIPPNRRRMAIDVGAHIGIFSVRMARMFARTLAFEPNADNYECLVMNTLRFPHVRPICAAIGETPGRCLSRIDALANSGARGISLEERGTPVMTLDAILDAAVLGQGFDLLKIDTEGHEEPVVLGGRRAIESFKPVMIIERPTQDTHAWLTSIGYGIAGRTSKDVVYAELK